MNPARFASNKTKLAQCLGISRTLLYEFMRLPDAPAPCADGRWSVGAFRKFIAQKRDSVKGSEREQLQIALLKAKLAREEYELREAQQATRSKIRDELLAHARGHPKSDKSRALFALQNRVADALQEGTGATVEEKDTRPAVKVVPFKQKAASNERQTG